MTSLWLILSLLHFDEYQLQLTHILQHSSRDWSIPLVTLLENRVYPFFLEPHTSIVGQPADCGPNASFKSFFTRAYNQWKRRNQRGVYTRKVWNERVGEAWTQMKLKLANDLNGLRGRGRKYKKGNNCITSAFKKTGLVPFDPYAENWNKGIKQYSPIFSPNSVDTPFFLDPAIKCVPVRASPRVVSDGKKLHVTVQVNITREDENDPALPVKIRKLVHEVAISSTCRNTLLEAHNTEIDENTRKVNDILQRTQGSSIIHPFKLGQSFSVDENIEMIKQWEQKKKSKRKAEEEKKKSRDEAKENSIKERMAKLEDLLFKSTAKLNDVEGYEIADLKKGGARGISKDGYISLLCGFPADKMRIDRDKYKDFKHLKLNVVKKMFWDKRCGVRDTDVKVGSSKVVWCMKNNFYQGTVMSRKQGDDGTLYHVEYTDGDSEDLSLEELQRKIYIDYTLEDIPSSEESDD